MGQNAEIVASIGDNDVDGGWRDANNACIIEAGSYNGSYTTCTKTGVDQPASDKNLYHEESNPVEAWNLSTESDESEKINAKVENEDVNIFSNSSWNGGKSKLAMNDNVGVLYSSDRSG